MSTSPYPVRLVGGHDLERSRLTVFFRIFLLIPHAIVLSLYAIAAFVVIFIAWFAALFTGRVPEGMHNFIAGFLRYYARVIAYGTILADPFPPFGSGGTYPVDLEIDPPVEQSRLTVFFRLILVLPCWILAGYALQPFLYLVAIGCWFVALFTGRVPDGLQTRRAVLPALHHADARVRRARQPALSGLRRHARDAVGRPVGAPPDPVAARRRPRAHVTRSGHLLPHALRVYVGPMNLLSRMACSLGLRLVLIPVIGVVVASVTQSGLAGLAAAIAAALLVLVGVRLEDWRRRAREKREHMAGLARW